MVLASDVAAASCGVGISVGGGGGDAPTLMNFCAALGSMVNRLSSSWWSFVRMFSSSVVGCLLRQVIMVRWTRLSLFSLSSLVASALAASVNVGSFRRVSAWRGVLASGLSVEHSSRAGAPKFLSMGWRNVRCQCVYIPRLYWFSPVLCL